MMELARRTFTSIAVVALMANSVAAATIQFRVDGGVLLVETGDADVKVALDGAELKVTGAGAEEIRLAVGPKLFQRRSGPAELLSVKKDDRLVVQVWAVGRPESPTLRMKGNALWAEAPPAELVETRERLIADARQIAGELVSLRSDLDARVWADVSQRWTTTEAAKLLVAFFRGNGELPGFTGTTDEAAALKRDLGRLRKAREATFAALAEAARMGSADVAPSPLCGVWEVAEVRGMGGLAADALELFDPDPVGRKFVAVDDAAYLMTGGGAWFFDATYNGDDAVDLSALVRGNTVYRGRYAVDGDEATVRVSVMNAERPKEADGEPTDGGFVLRLRRATNPDSTE